MRMQFVADAVGRYQRLPSRDRRALLMGCAILLPALLWVGAVRPYRAALSDLQDRIATERALLAREEGLLALRTTLPAALTAADRRAQQAELRLVRASNPALEEAELTRYLEQTAGASRVLLLEARGLPRPRGVDTTGVLRPVRLAVRGESDLQGVLTYVQRIEASPLLLRIVELSMEPVNDKSPDAQAGAITFALVLEAFAPKTGGSDE